MKNILKSIVIFLLFFTLINNVYAFDIPDIGAKNIYFVNIDDNDVIYEKDSDEKVKIASLTKIMTTLVSIENIDDYNKQVLVTYNMLKDFDIDYSTAGFYAGEVVTFNDLLYGSLLPSGADATNILSYSVTSTREEFIDLMNKKAKELGMINTHFSNPIGMDEDNYSTAKDLYILMKYVYKNKKFMEIFKSEEYTTSNNEHILKGPLKKLHSNDYSMNYVLGAKTGFTDEAGMCLASISKYKEKTYILINLGSQKETYFEHMKDAKKIYEYFFNNYDYKKILSKGETIQKIQTQYEEDYIIKSKEEVTRYIENSKKKKDLKYEYVGRKIITKDINKGDKIGTFYILDNDKILYKKDIYSNIDVKMSTSYFIKHYYGLIISISLLIMLIIVLLMKKKRKHRYKKDKNFTK